MKIKNIQIKNYKSFYSSDKLILDKGFNLVVGKNNSGKTAFLDSLSLNFLSQAHRTLKSKPQRTLDVAQNSEVEVDVIITHTEFLEFLENLDSAYFSSSQFPNLQELSRHLYEIFNKPDIDLNFTFSTSANNVPAQATNYNFKTFSTANSPGSVWQINTREIIDLIKNGTIIKSYAMTSSPREFGKDLGNYLKNKIYKFTAQRYNFLGPILRISFIHFSL